MSKKPRHHIAQAYQRSILELIRHATSKHRSIEEPWRSWGPGRRGCSPAAAGGGGLSSPRESSGACMRRPGRYRV